MFEDCYLSKFLVAYLECAVWASTDTRNEEGDDSSFLDNGFDRHSIGIKAYEQALKECTEFVSTNAEDLELYAKSFSAEHAGHDFWLTRNGHGAGFWDRGLVEVGEHLTEAAERAGERDLYAGDDDELYFDPGPKRHLFLVYSRP